MTRRVACLSADGSVAEDALPLEIGADSGEADEKDEDDDESYLFSRPQLPDIGEKFVFYCVCIVHFRILLIPNLLV